VNDSRKEYNATVDSANAAYDAYANVTPPGQRKPKARWLKEQGYADQIDASKKRLDASLVDMQIASRTIPNNPYVARLNEAVIRFGNPEQSYKGPLTREDIRFPAKWQSKQLTHIGGDLQSFLSETRRTTQSLDESHSTSSTFEQHWKASVKVKFLGLVRVGGLSTEETKREKQIQAATTRVEIGFDNLDVFPIVRGPWFDEGALNLLLPVLKTEVKKEIFGDRGQLELLPRSLLVARGLRFRIYADAATLDHVYSHFKGSADAGIKIGYFTVGAKGSGSAERSKTKDRKTSDYVEFYETTGRGQVLAIQATKLGVVRTVATASAELERAEAAAAVARMLAQDGAFRSAPAYKALADK
jgi:hypothetical protein